MFDLIPKLFPGAATLGGGAGSQAALQSPTAGTVGSLTVSQFVGLMPSFLPTASAAGAHPITVTDPQTSAAAREGSRATLQYQAVFAAHVAAERSHEARVESQLAFLGVTSLGASGHITQMLTETILERQAVQAMAAAMHLYGLGTSALAREGGATPGSAARAARDAYTAAYIANQTATQAAAARAGYTGKIPTFQHGGMVPGIGPMLAVVHGGERISPEGGGGTTVIQIHATIELDGEAVGEWNDKRMFRNATNTLSGFGAANPVTGA